MFKHIYPLNEYGFKTQHAIVITLIYISMNKTQAIKEGLHLTYTIAALFITVRAVVIRMVGGVVVVFGVVVVVVAVGQQ